MGLVFSAVSNTRRRAHVRHGESHEKISPCLLGCSGDGFGGHRFRLCRYSSARPLRRGNGSSVSLPRRLSFSLRFFPGISRPQSGTGIRAQLRVRREKRPVAASFLFCGRASLRNGPGLSPPRRICGASLQLPPGGDKPRFARTGSPVPSSDKRRPPAVPALPGILLPYARFFRASPPGVRKTPGRTGGSPPSGGRTSDSARKGMPEQTAGGRTS